jgi:hypothetical protein
MIDKGYDKTPEMTSDHPSLASRYKIAQDRARKMPDLPQGEQLRQRPVATPAEFAKYQQEAVMAAKNTPDDTSLAKTQKLLSAIPRSCLTPVDQKDQEQARQELMHDLQQQQQQAQQSGAATTKPAKRHRATTNPS